MLRGLKSYSFDCRHRWLKMSGGGTKRRASSEGAPVKRVKFLEDETNSPKRLPEILSSPIQVPSPSTLPEPIPSGSATPPYREKLRKPPSGDPIYPRDPDSPKPIPKTLVPGTNQFLAFDYSKRAGANKIDLLSEDCPPSLAAADSPTRPTRSTTTSIPITTAGAMQFFDTKLAVAGEKNVWRDLVYLLAIRYHHITTDDVVLKALPVRLQQHPAVRQAELVSLIKDFDQLQTSVQSWHYAGMKRTINMMGLKRWRSSTTSERRKVFEAIWAQDPLEMARGSLGLVKQVVPIDIIWLGDSEIHRKW